MTKNEFFNILMDGLKDFPETKLQDIISYYNHSFTIGLAAGKTEQEIITDLGSPNYIVKKCRDENTAIPTNWNEMNGDIKTSNTYNNAPNNNDSEFENINKIKDSCESISLSNDFYNLDTSKLSPDNIECNNKSILSNESSSNLKNNNEYNLNSTIKNNSSTDSNYNAEQNSNTFSNNFINKNFNNNSAQSSVNTILKICIAILTLIIFSPVITGVIGFVIGLFGISISIFVASIGVLVGGTFTSFMGLPNVPAFVANFPYPVIVLFSLGSISLSILLTLLFYYLCKFFIRLSIKIYNSFKYKGGAN